MPLEKGVGDTLQPISIDERESIVHIKEALCYFRSQVRKIGEHRGHKDVTTWNCQCLGLVEACQALVEPHSETDRFENRLGLGLGLGS